MYRTVVRDFRELVCWQLAHALKCEILEFTATEPAASDFKYCDQIRSSSASAPGNIAEAFGLLGHCELVFGPPGDGGFWLVGARRSPRLPPLFGPVRWSTRQALADTLANLPRRVSVGFAARLDDVDDGASWRRHPVIGGL